MKRILSIMLAVQMLILCSCANKEDASVDSFVMNFNSGDDVLTEEFKENDEFVIIAEDESKELFLKGTTTEIMVRNKADGYSWYSQPFDRGNDEIATGTNIELLNSPATFTYIDKSQKLFTVNAYEDSIAHKQFSYEKIEKGIRINYLVGEMQKQFVVPNIITKKRMAEICKNLNEIDAAMLLTYYNLISLSDLQDDAARTTFLQMYPALKNGDIYVMAGISMGEQGYSDFILETIEDYFLKGGYTLEKLEKDNKENLIESDKKENYSITFSIEYILEKGELVARIPHNSISFDDSLMTVTKMEFLPFFGAAHQTEQGYMLVPDGCGALIDLNSRKSGVYSYEKKVYGTDKSVAGSKKDSNDISQIYFPVFGIKTEKHAFLAVIESGASNASIYAQVSGENTSYNQIYPGFTIRSEMIQDNSMLNVSGNKVYQKENYPYDFCLRYLFLDNEESNYVGMADAYGSYLEKNGTITPVKNKSNELGFNITAIGAVTYIDSVLGFPVRTQKSLTSYSQAQNILKEILSQGIENIYFNYKGCFNGGVDNNRIGSVNLVSSLGSKKEFNTMNSFIKDNGIKFYPQLELQYISEKNKGFNKEKKGSRSLTKSIAYDYEYFLSTLLRDTNRKRIIVSPKAYDDINKKLIKDLNDLSLPAVALSSFGTDLNSDYNEKETYYRQEVANANNDLCKKISEASIEFSVDGANAYALKNCSFVNNIPLASSGNYLFDRDVPFMQFVLHGRIPYGSVPLNMESDYNTAVLKILESGTMPTFELIYEKTLALSDTENSFYSANYGSWKNEAFELYKELDSIYGDCFNSGIKSHNIIKKDVYCTEYDNGTRIYLNYSNKDIILNGKTITAKGYIFDKEGA